MPTQQRSLVIGNIIYWKTKSWIWKSFLEIFGLFFSIKGLKFQVSLKAATYINISKTRLWNEQKKLWNMRKILKRSGNVFKCFGSIINHVSNKSSSVIFESHYCIFLEVFMNSLMEFVKGLNPCFKKLEEGLFHFHSIPIYTQVHRKTRESYGMKCAVGTSTLRY